MNKTNLILLVICLLLGCVNFIFAEDVTSDEKTFGNKWYSGQTFVLRTNIEMGASGVKDYLIENSLFSYRFKSRNQHAFTIRLNHFGVSTGCFSGKAKVFNFSVMLGFEYLYKIFSNESGIFVLSDFGGGASGFCMYAAFGLGSHAGTNFTIDFNYMMNKVIMSALTFTVEIVKFFAIKGLIGVDSTYINDNRLDLFSFKAGAFFLFAARPIFACDFGGGITLNDYYAVSGFGAFSIRFSW